MYHHTRKNLCQAACLASLAFAASTHAGDNLWLNTSHNFIWDETSSNWLSPVKWLEGDGAIFGAAGAGTVNLGAAITVANLTFNSDATSYTIVGNGNTLVLDNGANLSGITDNATASLGASLQGVGGILLTGTGTTTLLGDPGTGVANGYTGGTFIRSGTLVLQARNSTETGPNYGMDSLEQLDAGATLKIGVIDNGPGLVTDMPKGQIGLFTSAMPPSRLHLTGGTFDLNGWSRNNGNTRMPCPDGTGLIINNSSNVQSAMVIHGDGLPHEFSGSINDGGAVFLNAAYNNDKGYQIGIIDLHYGTGNYEWTLSGSNTYSGSTRMGNGSIKLSGAGTLGVPSAIAGVTGPLRVYGPNHLDLNGTSQTIGIMGAGDANGKIYNTAVGTISTLNFGYGPNTSTCPSQFKDNDGVNPGGILALNKIGTGNQTLSGVNTYSGDTTVTSGTLTMQNATAVSPNTSFKLTTGGGTLALNYTGDVPVRSIYLDGVRLPDGTYGAGTGPITGTGTITVSPNTWNNGASDFTWNYTSADWTSPAIWLAGREAVFAGPVGAIGTINLSEPIAVFNLTFNNAGYTINGNGYPITLTEPGAGFIVNANATNAASLLGTSGLTVKGTAVLSLQGDGTDGNHYTGGTYVRGGTLILRNQQASSGGLSYAVDSIEAIDPGATVRYGSIEDGLDSSTSDSKAVNGQISTGGSAVTVHHLNLTGGTFDTYADDNNNQCPQPSGFGTIINSSPDARGICKFVAYGQTTEFSGQIKDGGITVAKSNNGPGYQNNVDSQAGTGGTLILSGSNSFTGFLRIGNGGTVKLKGAGTLGYPAPINCPTRQIIQNNGTIDLNGTSQKTGVYYAGSGASIINSAAGTTSILTLCYNATNSTVPSQGGILCNIQDTPGTTGLIGLTMAGGAANAIQAINGANNTYHGDTVVTSGILRFDQVGSISPNSTFRLSATHGTLALNYTGTANVSRLVIDGVEKPNGVYNSSMAPITGTGAIQVTGALVRPTLNFTTGNSGGVSSLTFSWTGSFKLQAQTNSLSSAWFDYPGGNVSPTTIAVDRTKQGVFFRLAP